MSSDLPASGRDARFNRWLPSLIVASLLVAVATIVLNLGIRATPSTTTDSQGRPMGFNDPLGAEHFLIIAQHFRMTQLLTVERAYEWLLLAMHGVGAWLLLGGRRSPKIVRYFFSAQAAIFPLGLAFCWVPPLLLISVFSAPKDREGFTDVPFTFGMGFMAHSFWVLFSLIIVFALRPRLELSLRRKLHAVGEAFFRATRVARQ